MAKEFVKGVTLGEEDALRENGQQEEEEYELNGEDAKTFIRANEEDFIQEISPLEYMIEASMNLDDLNDRLDLDFESEDYDSLGGFIIERLDRFPEIGDSVVTEDGIKLIIESLDKNRIESVHMYLPEKTERGDNPAK